MIAVALADLNNVTRLAIRAVDGYGLGEISHSLSRPTSFASSRSTALIADRNPIQAATQTQYAQAPSPNRFTRYPSVIGSGNHGHRHSASNGVAKGERNKYRQLRQSDMATSTRKDIIATELTYVCHILY